MKYVILALAALATPVVAQNAPTYLGDDGTQPVLTSLLAVDAVCNDNSLSNGTDQLKEMGWIEDDGKEFVDFIGQAEGTFVGTTRFLLTGSELQDLVEGVSRGIESSVATGVTSLFRLPAAGAGLQVDISEKNGNPTIRCVYLGVGNAELVHLFAQQSENVEHFAENGRTLGRVAQYSYFNRDALSTDTGGQASLASSIELREPNQIALGGNNSPGLSLRYESTSVTITTD